MVEGEGCEEGQLVGNGKQGLGLSQGGGYWRVVEVGTDCRRVGGGWLRERVVGEDS